MGLGPASRGSGAPLPFCFMDYVGLRYRPHETPQPPRQAEGCILSQFFGIMSPNAYFIEVPLWQSNRSNTFPLA